MRFLAFRFSSNTIDSCTCWRCCLIFTRIALAKSDLRPCAKFLVIFCRRLLPTKPQAHKQPQTAADVRHRLRAQEAVLGALLQPGGYASRVQTCQELQPGHVQLGHAELALLSKTSDCVRGTKTQVSFAGHEVQDD